MSFVDSFNQLPASASAPVRKFEKLIAPCSDAQLEQMATEAAAITRQRFGNTMRLFAPLYVSNECINNCSYCGFSRDNPIFRVTLEIDQVIKEAEHLAEQGFRNILLVAGEHPKFVHSGYLEDCLNALRKHIPTLSIEVGPMETPEYQRMVDAGCESLVVYQETYNRETYAEMHTAGPKKDFDWRLECPERGYEAGFRRLGIGALMGLTEPRAELFALAAHLDYLQRNCWRASFTISLPRLRPAAGGFTPRHDFTDRDLVQAVTAFRICFPDVGFVLSTRESAELRDSLAPLGITHMSAGSHTEPGGYTNQGTDDLHLTVKGRRVELESENQGCSTATEQFGIADNRSPKEIEALLRSKGLDPVWKDWDEAILDNNKAASVLLTSTQ